jgi:branched-subunit amino acid transport protein
MKIYLLILGMMLVTYIPRLLPSFFVGKLKFSKKFDKFINLIPYTAMTALIFPGVLQMDASHWYVGAIGGVVAIFLACLKKIPSAAVVLISVLSVMAVYFII